MKRRDPFDWDAAMAFGLGLLKLPPSTFWAMTPRELDAALAGHFGRARIQIPPSRRDLDAMMAAFPDSDGETEANNDRP